MKTKLDNLDTKIEDVKKVKNSGSSLSKAILVVVLSILAATVTLFGINRNSITALADKNTRQDVELVQHEGQNDLQFYQLNAKIDALLVSQGINPANLEIHIRKVPLK